MAMNLKVLNLNCQKGYQPGLEGFLRDVLDKGRYDVLILQEATDKVVEFLRCGPYGLIRGFNDDSKKVSELCIAYKSSFKIQKQGFQSFAYPCFGILWGDFIINDERIRIASLHLHSGVSHNVRLAELRQAKAVLSKEAAICTILSGDFNAGLPREPMRLALTLAPEFQWITKNLGPTLDSRFSENAPHLSNRVAAFLAFFNIRVPLRTDHLFIDREMANRCTTIAQVLPDRVSDHSPIEFMISSV